MDVVTAFLNDVLQEELYISQPEGYIISNQKSKVCRLLKSLYGLKQSARVWYEAFDNFLQSQKISRCTSDTNVYIQRTGSHLILLGLYIDDLIIISNDLLHLNKTKHLFSQRFSMTDTQDI
jgi:hypothetical protein